MWTNELFGFSFFGTLKPWQAGQQSLKPLSEVKPIVYPKPDGVVSFDKLSSVFLSNTNHEEDQPCHLRLKDPSFRCARTCRYMASRRGSIARRASMRSSMPMRRPRSDPKFVINAQNCVHCKTCDIKDPAQNITWTAPEGGGGPNYPNM
jgi:electron-transferring-flavoprotein dehydrogenase